MVQVLQGTRFRCPELVEFLLDTEPFDLGPIRTIYANICVSLSAHVLQLRCGSRTMVAASRAPAYTSWCEVVHSSCLKRCANMICRIMASLWALCAALGGTPLHRGLHIISWPMLRCRRHKRWDQEFL